MNYKMDVGKIINDLNVKKKEYVDYENEKLQELNDWIVTQNINEDVVIQYIYFDKGTVYVEASIRYPHGRLSEQHCLEIREFVANHKRKM